MEKIELTLLEFYNLVWSKPFLSLSKEYNISDNGLRKKCKKYGIPVPQNGYWATTDARRKTLKKAFKCAKEYKNEIIYLECRNLDIESGSNKINLLKDEIEVKYKTILDNEGILIKSIPIIPLIRSALGSKNGDFFYSSADLHHPVFFGDLKFHIGTIKISRILVVINTLFKILVKYGFDEIALTKGNLRYKEVSFTMVFREKLSINKFINEYGRSSQKLVPNGNLEIIMLNYRHLKSFSDAKTDIESRLSEIAAKIITIAEDENKRHLINEKEKLERKKRDSYNEIRDKIIEEDKKYFKMFVHDYDSWQKMTKLNEFIETIENTKVSTSIENHKQEWLEWAREKAKEMDPLRLGVENYLNRFEILEIPEMYNVERHS